MMMRILKTLTYLVSVCVYLILFVAAGCHLPPRSHERSSTTPSPSASPPVITSKLRLPRAQTSIRIRDFETARLQLSFISPSDPEYAEAKKLGLIIAEGLKVEEKKRREQERQRIPQLRDGLRIEFQQLLADANPHLNFVGSKLTKTKGGYALWATHEFFTQYTFSSGNDAKLVQDWIIQNESKLKETDIVRVGVMGRGSFASWSYFDVP